MTSLGQPCSDSVVAAIAHAPQSQIEHLAGFMPGLVPKGRKQPAVFTGDGLQIAQNIQSLPGQRDIMGTFHFHLDGWNAPCRRVPFDFAPFRLA